MRHQRATTRTLAARRRAEEDRLRAERHRQGGSAATPMDAPSRHARLHEFPLVTYERWQQVLVNNPPAEHEQSAGPPAFPLHLLPPVARELGATLVISPRAYIGRYLADRADLTFSFPGEQASDLVRAALELFAEQCELRAGEPPPPPPVFLMVDVGASQVDSMSGMISSLMIPCHLIAIAQEGATTAGNPDPIALMTTAHAA